MGYILVVIAIILILPQFKTDDTDKSFFNRSGMYLYTDNKTGLQYLGARGSLTPRLDENGKHMRVSR